MYWTYLFRPCDGCLINADVSTQLLLAADTIDQLWSSFEIENNLVPDSSFDLDLSEEYSNDLMMETFNLVIFFKSVTGQYRIGTHDQRGSLLCSRPHSPVFRSENLGVPNI